MSNAVMIIYFFMHVLTWILLFRFVRNSKQNIIEEEKKEPEKLESVLAEQIIFSLNVEYNDWEFDEYEAKNKLRNFEIWTANGEACIKFNSRSDIFDDSEKHKIYKAYMDAICLKAIYGDVDNTDLLKGN